MTNDLAMAGKDFFFVVVLSPLVVHISFILSGGPSKIPYFKVILESVCPIY